MSSLATPEEEPFVFGVYATHVSEAAPTERSLEGKVTNGPAPADAESTGGTRVPSALVPSPPG